ncbi:hypothetical protein ACPEEZ_01580 [Frigoribacterium sp. 2-23]|uniref:hypothetical protein n=1 Tax=Frigoribacterium sp. 2-23 TaxID=3415006 RepID=UPI003C705240
MTAPWTPPRPDAHTAIWEPRPGRPTDTAPPGFTALDDDASEGGAGPDRTPSRPRRVVAAAGRALRARWQAASRGRRAASSLAALLLVAGLVAVLGSAVQPSYPALAAPGQTMTGTDPFGRSQGTGPMLLDDLRALPTGAAWTTDLRAALAPGTTTGCVSYRQVGTVGSDVLVGTSWLGGGGDCIDAIGRVARIDPGTGRIEWTADIRAALDIGDPQYVTVYPDSDDRAATVSLSRQVGTPAVRLDLRTGEILGTIVRPDDVTFTEPGSDSGTGSGSDAGSAPGYDPSGLGELSTQGDGSSDSPTITPPATGVHSLTTASSGAFVVGTIPREYFDGTGAMTYSSDDPFHYDLYRVADPTTPIWSGDVMSSSYPTMMDGRMFVELFGGGQISVDTTTGAVTHWPTSLSGVNGAFSIEGQLYVVTSGDGSDGDPTPRNTLTALGEGAVPRWSADISPNSQPTSGPGCLTVTELAGGISCLDVDTGTPRWTLDPPVQRGQSAQQVYAVDRPSTQDTFVQIARPDRAYSDTGTGDADDTRLAAFDSLTGARRYDVALPGLIYLAGTGRTTGYAFSYSSSSQFGASVLTAFDLADGHHLWTLDDPSIATEEFWQGTLVTVSSAGVARGLRDDVTVAG